MRYDAANSSGGFTLKAVPPDIVLSPKLRRAVAELLEELADEELKNTQKTKPLSGASDRKAHNIVHLICRATNYEAHSKDYEYSRLSMEDHRRAGLSLWLPHIASPRSAKGSTNLQSVLTFDLATH
jgi:NTE family protein